MKLYTIGFTQKTAEAFFGLLGANGIRQLVDIRVNPQGQLSGFAKQDDLPYLLRKLADDCRYLHLPLLAPTKAILKDYRADGDWSRYVMRFEQLMDERGVPSVLARSDFEASASCLLCSEAMPERCHRRLVADRLAAAWPAVEIFHL